AEKGKWQNYSDDFRYCLQMHELTHNRDDPPPACGPECEGDPCAYLPSPSGMRGECRAARITSLCLRAGPATDPNIAKAAQDAVIILSRCRSMYPGIFGR